MRTYTKLDDFAMSTQVFPTASHQSLLNTGMVSMHHISRSSEGASVVRTCSSMKPSSACELYSDERLPTAPPGAPFAPGSRSHGPSTCSQRSA